MNSKKLKTKKMRLELRKKCGTSWLEWHLPANSNSKAINDINMAKV